MTWHVDTPDEYKDAIVTGDARELAARIPDESVDLIFTDPPYPREFLPLYGWLAETAARVLRPGGLCLTMAGQSYLPAIYSMMAAHLEYHWTFLLETPGQKATIWPRRISPGWKPVISWSKGAYNGPWFGTDMVHSAMNDKRFHHWGQSESAVMAFLSRLPGQVVFEPFVGGGSTIVVCRYLRRHYIGFELDATQAETARQRVRDTQPPLLVVDPEQLSLAV